MRIDSVKIEGSAPSESLFFENNHIHAGQFAGVFLVPPCFKDDYEEFPTFETPWETGRCGGGFGAVGLNG